MWAKNLGGDSAIKLLNKLSLLDQCIDYAVDTVSFDFAFELAKNSSSDRISDIQMKYAMYLEDEGRFNEAEEYFVKAGKPKEAVLMYVHQSDWINAKKVAEEFDPESLVDVLIGQARVSFDNKDYAEGETFLLRAQRPELAIKFYKEHAKWSDVLRIAKEYLPHKLASLQDECDQAAATGDTNKGVEAVISQARDWEARAEYNRAIDLYLRVTTDMTTNHKSD